MSDKDLTAWRKAIKEDPEAEMYCRLMFYEMEGRVFDDMNDYVIDQGRKLASKMSIYAASKGYEFSKDEVLEGFKTAAPVIQGIVKTAWEQVLGDYARRELAKGEAAKQGA